MTSYGFFSGVLSDQGVVIGTVNAPAPALPPYPDDTLVLLSCVGGKAAIPMPAEALYETPFFARSRRYAISRQARWAILSAKYGLVWPHEVIAPYQITLKKLPPIDRKAWADRVLIQLAAIEPRPRAIVFLAGKAYREFLTNPLTDQGIIVTAPLSGVQGLGAQMKWFESGGYISEAK